MAWIDSLFQRMVQNGASDLHMTSTLVPMFRLHGDMIPVEGCPVINPEQMQTILFEIAPADNKKEFGEANDTDFAYELPGQARFRANLFRDHRGPGGVFRLIPSKIASAEQLGLPKAIIDLCHLSKGLVLVTGPTGSGKSTTLAAMVDWINTNRDGHIITIEDPIEFVHVPKRCMINQREVGSGTYSFSNALRSSLREDPDVILVGELRDLETIALAITAAETGHLVFGTLHTMSAPKTIDRLINVFPAGEQAQIRAMLAESLAGVVAQVLLGKVGGGRVAAHEILISTHGVRSMIREGKTHMIPNAIKTGGKLGMQSLENELTRLADAGIIEGNDAASALGEEVADESAPPAPQLSRAALSAPAGRPVAAVAAPVAAAEGQRRASPYKYS